MERYDDRDKYRRQYEFDQQVESKLQEADIYSVIGIGLCVCLYLAFTIFPKG